MKVNAYRPAENSVSRSASFVNLQSAKNIAVERIERSLSQKKRFPEPAITREQPNRYNTQLNEQITAIQIADHYLSTTQKQIDTLLSILPYRDEVEIQAPLVDFIKHLQQRVVLSGHYVDSQLKVNIIDEPKLYFMVFDTEKWFSQGNNEHLLFTTQHQGVKHYAMVKIDADYSVEAQLAQLNFGLGKLGIRALMSTSEELVFSVNEKIGEERVTNLAVKGQGKLYPDDHFVPMKVVPSMSVLATVTNLIQRSEKELSPLLNGLQNLYDHVAEQRDFLLNDRQQLQQNFSSTLAALFNEGAQNYAHRLNQALNQDNVTYSAVSQLLQAQPYLYKETVKTILR